jgi:hypothetical protein
MLASAATFTLWGVAEAMGCGAYLLLVGAELKDEQRLRKAVQNERRSINVAMTRLMVKRQAQR